MLDKFELEYDDTESIPDSLKTLLEHLHKRNICKSSLDF